MDSVPPCEVDDESALLPLVTESLSTVHKELILNRIWGFDLPSANRANKFKAFFEHYQSQTAEQDPVAGFDSVIRTHEDVLYFVEVLKNNPNLTRNDLKKALKLMASGGLTHLPTVMPNTASPVQPLLALNEAAEPARAIDSALAMAIRIMFAINLSISPGRILVGQSDVVWEESKSLETLIRETYPVHDFGDEPSSPIKPNKLRARYLETHADIQIVWTRHLPDHLKLDVGPRNKILRIFELASLLEMTYEAISKEALQLPLSDSLRNGCYQPVFLYETLRTFLLLFPAQDRQWLERKINPASRWFRMGRKDRKLDKRLSAPFKCLHQGTLYDRPLTTRRELFARYPHWAVRLHILFIEAEDPAPVSLFGKWAERRKAARHTFWLTFIAFVVAILFGIVATILSALQVWITYCQWQGETASGVCKSPTPTTVLS